MSGANDVNRPEVRAKLTYEDFLLFPDDGQRHELIDGEHVVTPSPNTKHQVIVGNLYWIIRQYLEAHPVGRVFFAPFDVVFSKFDVVEPDLLFISNDRLAVLTEQHVRGAPDLVVEILSEGTRKRDETTKRHLYDRFDVSEYWVVDPVLNAIKVYRRGEGKYERAGEYELERADRFGSPLLPGLTVMLADVFRE
jgi:Uma2 family endonuclease